MTSISPLGFFQFVFLFLRVFGFFGFGDIRDSWNCIWVGMCDCGIWILECGVVGVEERFRFSQVDYCMVDPVLLLVLMRTEENETFIL